MTDVTIIHVGNIKDEFFMQALDEYKKRLSGFCRLKEIEIKEEKCDTQSEVAKCLEREGEKIIAAFPKKGIKIALCVEGKQQDSEEFASLINKNTSDGIAFIIGSSYGLSEKVKSSCNIKLSFSKMTFPHRLMRVILYEQVYRAFTIINGRKYHK